MPYYIRVLGKDSTNIPLEKLRKAADPAVLGLEEGTADAWAELVLKHKSGREIAVIERNSVVEGDLGADELKEFVGVVPHYKPQSAVDWLLEFFPSVKVVYAFQLLSGTDVDDGWTILHSVYGAVWNHAGGILQADGEGFSDEDGFTILWQFGEKVKGPWKMGIRLPDGRWIHFEMDLGNPEHRESFWRGEAPAGVRIL